MAVVEYFLDETPGETRGIVARGGEYHALYIERSSDPVQHRRGTRQIGRVARVEPGLKAAFIDLGVGDPLAFMALPKNIRLDVGAKVEITVSAEPRESKGAVVKYVAPASGDVRVLEAGPSVRDRMQSMAGDQLMTGLPALRASLEAEEAALTTVFQKAEFGLDLSVERTRALVSVDIDYAPLPGRDSRKGREAVNRAGLFEAARIIGLKGWGGLVVVDLAGVYLQAESVNQAARQAFAQFEDVAFGPLSRFGALQLSLPWHGRPVDEVLRDSVAAPLGALRRLNLAIHEDRTQPVWTLEAGPQWSNLLKPLVAELGPRARLVIKEQGAALKVSKG